MEVEVREAASPDGPRDSTTLLVNNASANTGSDGPVVIVRAEEVLLVVLVLILWVAAIALFFNRWGKIRMLEPYQPKFQQTHRPSCPLAPLSPPGVTPQQRMSFSKYNVSCLNDTLYSGLTSPNPVRRLRQNSVFVGSSTMAFLNPPRRTKSAIDIQHLVLNESSPTSFSSCNSMLPMVNPYRERKPSVTIERAGYQPIGGGRRRPSMAATSSADRGLLPAHLQHARNRRPSCCADRLFGRHKNFLSFDQPALTFERRMSMAAAAAASSSVGGSAEKSFHQPTVSFETPSESSSALDRPFLVVDPPSTTIPPTCVVTTTTEAQIAPLSHVKKTSYSFEQPSTSMTTTPRRMTASLENTFTTSTAMISSVPETTPATICLERRASSCESDRSSPVSIILLDETKITAPLLESLKSTDV